MFAHTERSKLQQHQGTVETVMQTQMRLSTKVKRPYTL